MFRIILVLIFALFAHFNCELNKNDNSKFVSMIPGLIVNMPKSGQQGFNYEIPPPVVCASASPRLHMNLTKMYGKWYPIQASKMAYQLWVTSLYGEEELAGTICPIWKFLPGLPNQFNSMRIQISHGDKKITMNAFMFPHAIKSDPSEWVTSWPNGEDTLTSIVAIGGMRENSEHYDWMLTIDCDISGVISSDWAILSRTPTMTPQTLAAIGALVHGKEGLQTFETTRTQEACSRGHDGADGL